MKHNFERVLCFLLAAVMCLGMTAPAVHAADLADPTDSTEAITAPSDPAVPSSEPASEPSDPTVPSSEPEKPSEVTLSFEIGEGAKMYDTKPVVVAPGSEVDVSKVEYTPKREGYAFYGWYTEADGNGEKVEGVFTLNADTTLYAKWVKMTALDHNSNIDEIAQGHYTGDAYSDADQEDFVKISHPWFPGSTKFYDPSGIDKKDSMNNPTYLLHQYEIFTDGLVDYLGRLDGLKNKPGENERDKTAMVGVPFEDKLEVKDSEGKVIGTVEALGQGDRGMSYSWSGLGYGDWLYVTLQFNPAGQTNKMLQVDVTDEQSFKTYGGDNFKHEEDYGTPGCALCKVNVKTGEVKILMSRATNNLDAQFRNAVEFNGKLYFCGGVNHLPSIYEVDPETDAFQCVYQDETMLTYPGGWQAAWPVATAKKICPTIRGLTAFELEDQKFLVISCVGMDGNPYIAVSDNPSSGHFTKIAQNYKPGTALEDQLNPENKGELLGYAAYKTCDSIFGGSIWEMAQIGNKLYVAMCTGTPENAPEKKGSGEKLELVTMQSFALMEGELREGGKVDNPDDWTWTPIAGDKEADGAKYTWGFDPERTRAGACNLLVFNDMLYIGEYNDNQIAFKNMAAQKFDHLNKNVDQGVSLYRLNPETREVELVMGTPTQQFPAPIAGSDSEEFLQRDVSGFGRQELQYFWQSKVFNGKMYLGTMDITKILNPLGKAIGEHNRKSVKSVEPEMNEVLAEAEAAVAASTYSVETSVYQDILDARDFYEARKGMSTMADFVEEHGDDPFVPLPEGIFDEAPMIEVNSVDTLYAAMLAVTDLMKGNDEWNSHELLQSQARLSVQMDEIATYVDNTDDEIPATLMAAVETARFEHESIKGMQDLLKYMEGAIEGFDLFVSEDGVNFKAVTRTGMSDPYNNGLRVFAINEKDDGSDDANASNPWMCIGSANSFYGTQIWRMDADNLNHKVLTPEKQYIDLRFIDENGQRVQKSTEHDIGLGTVICLDKTATHVNHSDIVNLYLDGAQENADVPATLEIKSDENGNYVEVPCTRAYALQYAVNGGKYMPGEKFPAGTVVDLTAKENIPVKPGYTFAGWYTDKDLSEGNEVTEITMDGHKFIYAKWTEGETPVEEFTLSFDTNGGSAIEAVVAASGTVIDLTQYVPTQAGYAFDGWYSNAALSEHVDSITLTGNTTVYAKWAKAHTLTFEVNGGSAIDAASIKEGTVVDLSQYTTTREGYTFEGWFSDAELQNAVTSVTMDQDVTVYASWKEIPVIKYTLSFDVNGGSALEPVEFKENTEVDLSVYVPTQEGFVFAGWYSDDALTEAVTTVTMTGDMTVHAKWTVAHTLTFESNGGVAIDPITVAENTVIDLKDHPTAMTGYVFLGWYTEPEFINKVESVTMDKDITVYAKFEPEAIENPFTDVHEGDYYYDAVMWAVKHNITGGVTETTFGPNNPATRAQSVTFLWKEEGQPIAENREMKFTDVDVNMYYAEPVRWAVEKGITSGISDTIFGTNNHCTRGQIMVFLWKLAGAPVVEDAQNSFVDVHKGDYFYNAVMWAVQNGITKGADETHFAPQSDCNRAQIMTFLYAYANNK